MGEFSSTNEPNPKPMSVDISTKKPLAPAIASHVNVKPVGIMAEAARFVGVAGIVSRVTADALAEAPPALTALSLT